MADSKEQIQNAESRIEALMKLPPHSSWSYQRSAEFKETYKQAMSYMSRKSKKLERLIEIERKLRNYF